MARVVFVSDQEKMACAVLQERKNEVEHTTEYIVKPVLPKGGQDFTITDEELSSRGFKEELWGPYNYDERMLELKKEWFEVIKDIKVIPNAVLIRLSENGKIINRLYDNDKVVAEWE